MNISSENIILNDNKNDDDDSESSASTNDSKKYENSTKNNDNNGKLITENHQVEMYNNNSELKKKRGKKKKLHLTICTTNCKYELIRRVAEKYGMKEVSEDSPWNLYWADLSVGIERAKDMKRFQKINHFPGMTEICRKDLLARNLNRMQRLYSKDYNFFPKTWCLPADYGDIVNYAKKKKSKTFIIKPDTGCQGRGIYLTKSLKDIKPYDRMICQVYLSKPLLVDGYKFDLRVYTLITSCDPLRIYVYNDGLARFATSRYKEPTSYNTSNVFMHLTNYAVNKHSRMYVNDDAFGSKRKISTLNRILKINGCDVDELWSKIDEIIVKTILSAYPILKHNYKTCFSTHDLTYACFEILGFDIIIDWKLKPYLLEVNHSPSFHTDAQIDKDIKEGLLTDTFRLLNLHQCDKKKIMEEDRQRVRNRLLQGITTKETCINDTAGTIEADELANEQEKWENENMGNYRKIYPCDNDDKYNIFFKQNGNSMFQDTSASRAREEASKIQREEAILRTKEEECKRMSNKYDMKLDTDRINKKNSSTLTLSKNKCQKKDINITPLIIKKSKLNLIKKNTCSFVPEVINDIEEKKRIDSLIQREFLIKSHGILEHIYLTMKKNGNLRPVDIRKYSQYEKLIKNEKPKDLLNKKYKKINSQFDNINDENSDN